MGLRVTVKEAAKQTGLSETELRRGAACHTYPCLTIGAGTERKRILFDIDELNACIAELSSMNLQQPPQKKNRAIPEKLGGRK